MRWACAARSPGVTARGADSGQRQRRALPHGSVLCALLALSCTLVLLTVLCRCPHGPELPPRAIQPRGDGSLGNLEHRSDLALMEPFDVYQPEYCPKRHIEGIQGSRQPSAAVVLN